MNKAMHRRTFLRHSSLFLMGTAMAPARAMVLPLFAETAFESKRPPVEKRTFVSEEVEKTIRQVKALIADEELAWLFENCYPNTLDTTVDFEIIDGKPDTFIITGDIDAMWLRDSTAQVWPYLPLINRDPKLKQLVAGLINRQARCVLLDPFANAFYKDFSRVSEWIDDKPTPIPGVHERKWEVDSLCYVVRLAARYHELTGDASVFDAGWDQAMRMIVQTFRTEQRKDGTTPYAFVRKTTNMIDAAPFNGKGRPIKPTGLICSAFRPSDDAADFPFLIPSNIFAALSLRQLAGIYQHVLNDAAFARECSEFAAEVEDAVKRIRHFKTPGLRKNLRLRSGRIREQALHGRRQCALPDVARLSGRAPGGRPHLSKHAEIPLERCEPLFPQRPGGGGAGQSTHRQGAHLAHGDHPAGHDGQGGSRGCALPENAEKYACGHGFHARVLPQGRPGRLHAVLVRLGQHPVWGAVDQGGGRKSGAIAGEAIGAAQPLKTLKSFPGG